MNNQSNDRGKYITQIPIQNIFIGRDNAAVLANSILTALLFIFSSCNLCFGLISISSAKLFEQSLLCFLGCFGPFFTITLIMSIYLRSKRNIALSLIGLAWPMMPIMMILNIIFRLVLDFLIH